MGACLVNSAKAIVGTDCNTMPNGCKISWTDPCRLTSLWYATQFLEINLPLHLYGIACHAETDDAITNAIPNKVSNDLSDSTLYVGYILVMSVQNSLFSRASRKSFTSVIRNKMM